MLQNTQTQIKNNMQDLVNNANHSSALVTSPAVQMKGSDGRYKTLKEFYPFYLGNYLCDRDYRGGCDDQKSKTTLGFACSGLWVCLGRSFLF